VTCVAAFDSTMLTAADLREYYQYLGGSIFDS